MSRRQIRFGSALQLTLVGSLLTACSHTLATTSFSDGTTVRLDGKGTESQVAMTCLNENQINQLTGGNTPPGAPKASCYEVAVITTKSSQISNAITAYFQAERNLSSQVASALSNGPAAAASAAAAASPVAPASPVAAAAANAIVADVVAGKDASEGASGLRATLSAQTRGDVAQALQSLSSRVADPEKAAAIKKAAAAVQ